MEQMETEARFSASTLYSRVVKNQKLIAALALVIVIVATIACFIYTHLQYKAADDELANLKVKQFVTELSTKYRDDISNTHFAEGTDLITLHESLKASTLQKFDKSQPTTTAEVYKTYRQELSSEIDKVFYSFRRKLRFDIETKADIAENLVKLLTHTYSQAVKAISNEMESEMNNQSNIENTIKIKRKEIMGQFQFTKSFPENSTVYRVLKAKLKGNLNSIDEEIKKTAQVWNSTIEKAKEVVLQYYLEVYSESISTPPENEFINPYISFEVHEKIAESVIFKSVYSKLVPANLLLQQELKMYLTKIYQKKVSDNMVIGIDFKDICSYAAVYFQNEITMIPPFDEDGQMHSCTPSYVGVGKYDGYVGQSAKELVRSSVETTPVIYNMKQIIWKLNNDSLKIDDQLKTFSSYMGANNTPMVSVEGSSYTIGNVLSKLFHKIKTDAEMLIRFPIQKCVLSVPPYFDALRRNELSVAASIAGFTETSFLEDTTAPLVALQQRTSQWISQRKVLVITFDTFDWRFDILEGFKENFHSLDYRFYEGGLKIRENLLHHCFTSFAESEKLDPNLRFNDTTADRIWKRRLMESVERGILSLSTEMQTTITVSNFYGGRNLNVTVDRSNFEAINSDQFHLIVTNINSGLNAQSLKYDNISNVIITGHFSGIPGVVETVQSLFPGKPLTVPGILSEKTIAYGVAVKGAMIWAEAIKQSFRS